MRPPATSVRSDLPPIRTRTDGDGNPRRFRAPYVIPLSLDGREILSFDTPLPEEGRRSGWAAYLSDDLGLGKGEILLRVGPCDQEPSAPLVIREMRLRTDRPVSIPGSSLVRLVPWERIEAAVNQPSRRRALVQLVAPFHTPPPDPKYPAVWSHHRPAQSYPAPDLKLADIPDGYRKPDSFYADVAERFLQAGALSSRPALDLAEANGVKPTTVHRWIREAKARGLLALPADRRQQLEIRKQAVGDIGKALDRVDAAIAPVADRAEQLGLGTSSAVQFGSGGLPAGLVSARDLAEWGKGVGEAEKKSGRRLGEPAAVIVALSRVLWGRTLTEERDRVISERDDDPSPDRLRTLRGQVTRRLVDEIAAEITRRETNFADTLDQTTKDTE